MTPDWITPDWPAPANVRAGTATRGADPGDLPDETRMLTQVHGAAVVNSADPAFTWGRPEADAIVSLTPGDTIAIRTADCLPVLLCSDAGDAVAAVHCGWRSLAADILANTVAQMHSDPQSILAWLGPAISQAAFEVQDDVREPFVTADPGATDCFERNARGRWQADLYGLARRKLAATGIKRVSGGGWCTFGDPGRFYSYRREQDTGRMISFISFR